MRLRSRATISEPPWGAPNSEEYVRRVERNLQSLDELSDLRLNYQWSALEIHNMLRDYPHMRERMLKHYHNGKLDFIDGTFSQAHLQILSSESNWRQFEYGLQVYRDLLDKEVDIYSRQETGLHVQLPQLLNIFGYRFATIPGLFQALRDVFRNKGRTISGIASAAISCSILIMTFCSFDAFEFMVDFQFEHIIILTD